MASPPSPASRSSATSRNDQARAGRITPCRRGAVRVSAAVKHCTVDLDGPVHYADFGGSGRPIVLVHGLGGPHLNWLAVAPGLTPRARVLALDLARLRRTPTAGRTARVGANRKLL